MNVKSLLSLGSLVVLTTALTISAQSLTEVAKQEKARRAKVRASSGDAKLYTEGDRTGDGAATSTAPADGGAATPAPPGTKKKEKTPEEQTADKQKEWADRVKKAEDGIKSLEEAITKNERSLASMYNITPARADMANAIEADRKKLADLKQSLVALEDERRRSGIARPR